MNICNEWRNNPSINPKTGRKIKIGGKVYNELKKECEQSSTNRDSLRVRCKSRNTLSPLTCAEWRKNPNLNPKTGRKIKINGDVYNRFKKHCTGTAPSPPPSNCSFKSFGAFGYTTSPTPTPTRFSKPEIMIPAEIVYKRYGLNVALDPLTFAKLQQIHHRFHGLPREKLAAELGITDYH